MSANLGGMMGGSFGNFSGPSYTTDSIINSTDPFSDGSLIAKYLLNGDVTDLCGNYDGTATAVTYSSTSKFGDNSADMSDSTSTIDIGTITVTDFSFSTFVKHDTAVTFSALHNNDTGNAFIGTKFNDDNTFTLDFDDAGTGATTTNTQDVFDGNWNNITVTRKGDVGSVYINGVLLESVTVTSSSITFKNISRDSVFGLIDQVEIYNRALNPQEVQMIYTQSKYSSDPTKDISGLVAHYPLNGTAEDLTGNYNGTENGVTYVESEMGIASLWDNTDDTINIPVEAFKPRNSSISFWLKSNNLDDTDSIIFYSYSTDNRWYFSQEGGEVGFRQPDNSGLIKAGNLSTDNFNHYIVNRDGTDKVVVYENGVEIINDNFSHTDDSPTSVHIGDDKLIGNIKNIRIYNKALTANEIETIYNYEKITRNIVIDRGLVAYYPLKNSSEDHWVSQYDGTDNGDVSYDGVSASLDGDGDYLKFPEIAVAKTLSFWMNIQDTDNSGAYVFDSSADNGRTLLAIDSDDNVLKMYTAGWDDIGLSGKDDGTWHYIVLFATSADLKTLSVYCDTIEVFNDTIADEFHINNTDFTVGSRYSEDTGYIKGSVSNIRMYNRVLSQEEISTIYNTEKGEFE